jgi:hypothetical protein
VSAIAVRGAVAALLAGAVLSAAACGSATSPAQPVAQARTSSTPERVSTVYEAPPANVRARSVNALARDLARAKETYANETEGAKLHRELARIAHDRVLLDALARGDAAAAQAEGDSQLHIPLNHFAHVTRIGVDRGARALVNATINADGVFVIPPARRTLTLHGRELGTLLVSVQDVTGFVKLVHNLTGAEVLARGASGRERTSLPAAMGIALPHSGSVTIAGARYAVGSFSAADWGSEPNAREPLTIWVLARV